MDLWEDVTLDSRLLKRKEAIKLDVQNAATTWRANKSRMQSSTFHSKLRKLFLLYAVSSITCSSDILQHKLFIFPHIFYLSLSLSLSEGEAGRETEREKWFMWSLKAKMTFKILKPMEQMWYVTHSVEIQSLLCIHHLLCIFWRPIGIIRQIATQKHSMKLHF